jgi:hypothetical protein
MRASTSASQDLLADLTICARGAIGFAMPDALIVYTSIASARDKPGISPKVRKWGR